MPKPRTEASANDPRCIDLAGGLRWGKLFDDHRTATGESMKDIAAAVGIGVENLYAYMRGHQVAQPATEQKLMRYLGKPTPEGVRTTQVVEDGYLVITTRIPLSEIAA